MKIVVSCTDAQREELTAHKNLSEAEIIYVYNALEANLNSAISAFIDLNFENNPERLTALQHIPAQVIIVNSVTEVLSYIHPSFIRISAWPTFLSSDIIEASDIENKRRKIAEAAFSIFHKKIAWVPDEPGFITPRIICMIINEAYFALSEGISTKEEMNIAMKSGANYPYGPFEWAQKIGLKNIIALLTSLNRQESRYTPCQLLLDEFASSQVHGFTSL